MNRSLVSCFLLAAAAVGLASASCNTVVCGPGTKQVQQSNGDTRCVPVDVQGQAGYPCDLDGGATLVGNVCQSAIHCGPNTTFDPNTGLCIGTGGPTLCTPPVCLPGANKTCINGAIRNLADNTCIGTKIVQVSLYLNPLGLIQNPNIKPDMTTMSDMNGTYIFNNFDPPGQGLVAIIVGDATGTATPTLQATAAGGQNIATGPYQIDAYSITKAQVAGWSAATAIDYDAKGGYLAEYFCELPPAMATASEKTPAPMVKFFDAGNGMIPATVRYFDLGSATATPPSLGALNTASTSTSMAGAAIVPGDGVAHTYTGQGGNCTVGTAWESFPGASIPHLVFVTRFHRM